MNINWTLRLVFAIVLLVAVFGHQAKAQILQTRANEIRAAMDARNFERAETLVRELRTTDAVAFTDNNYDYLLARLLERRGARSEASSLYLELAGRGGMLTQYALWHLAIARQGLGRPCTRTAIHHPLAGQLSIERARSQRRESV